MHPRTIFCWAVILGMAIQISSLSAQQGGPSQRTALVIGNANYPDADRPLTVAVRDARAIAEELRRSGFEVDVKENVTKEAMRSAIDAFTNPAKSGCGRSGRERNSGWNCEATNQG